MTNVENEIHKKTQEEFGLIRQEALKLITKDSDIGHTRSLLKKHLFTTVMSRHQMLLDTLISSLVDEANAFLENTSDEIKNDFYDLNLANKSHAKFSFSSQQPDFKFDPRYYVSGGSASLTSLAVYQLAKKVAMTNTVSGLLVLLAGGLVFTVMYKKTSNFAVQQLRKEIDEYLTIIENIMLTHFNKVTQYFHQEVSQFCSEKNIESSISSTT